jgi:hypothetical protein
MKTGVAIVLFISLLVAMLAVSDDSLWIDEAISADYATAPNFSTWWPMVATTKGSEAQMPLYMLYLWAWEKLCGSSEWALRAANIPWFLLAQASLWVGLRRRPGLQLATAICGACDPFLWRYLDEARPYAMQYAGSAVAVSCLAALVTPDAPALSASWLLAFGAGLLILCGSTALGFPWAGAAVLAFLCLTWRRRRVEWNFSSLAASLAPLLALGGLAAYYAWTVERGAGGAEGVGHRLASICFAAYEVLGFAGLGPSRISVSTVGSPGLFLPFLETLVPLVILLGGVLLISAATFFRRADFRTVLAPTIYVVLPLSSILCLVWLKDFHAVGRHFTALAPVVVLAIALALAAAWEERSNWKIAWTSAFLLLWLASCLELRFAARHRRDDYRDAARDARVAIALGKRVWWVASASAAKYYHLPMTNNPNDTSGAFLLWHPALTDVADLPPPDAVFVSKPAIFDPAGTVSNYLATHQYHRAAELPAFSIWEK